MNNTVLCKDGLLRCKGAASSDAFIAYHDEEWGVPKDNNVILFENCILKLFSRDSVGEPFLRSGAILEMPLMILISIRSKTTIQKT